MRTPTTIHAATLASISGYDRRHLLRLAQAGTIPKPVQGRYPTRETLTALFKYHREAPGDLKTQFLSAKTRLAEADAHARELRTEERAKNLYSRVLLEEIITNVMLPIRQLVTELPSAMATRCNPTQPRLARESLQRWADDFLASTTASLKSFRPPRHDQRQNRPDR